MHPLKYTFFAATSVALVSAAACSSSETTPAGTSADASTEAASNKDTGTSADPDSGTPACSLGVAISNEKACNDCAEENCCQDLNACFEDKDCTDFLTCATACLSDAGVPLDGDVVDAGGAAACAKACQTAHKSGAILYNTASQCVQGPCKSACTN